IVFTLNTIFIMGMATVVAGCPDRRLLRSTASLYSIYAIPFVVYILLTGDRLWGRLSAGLQPIMWGLMGLTICLGAFARKPGLVALGAVCVGLASILEASARESLLSFAIALIVVIPLYFRGMNHARLFATLAVLCGVLAAATVLFDPY